MITYGVKFAEVPFEITERGVLREYCDPYLSDETPQFGVYAADDDPTPLLTLHRDISTKLIDHDVVLFHASAIAYKGEGVLFAARSGTGKSTHANYWKEVFGDDVTYINDDKPYIRPYGRCGEDTARAYGSPWCGKHRRGANVSAPVKAICILERGDVPAITEISASEVLRNLYIQIYRPSDPLLMARTLELLDALLHRIKLYRLICNLDPRSARIAKEGIFGK